MLAIARQLAERTRGCWRSCPAGVAQRGAVSPSPGEGGKRRAGSRSHPPRSDAGAPADGRRRRRRPFTVPGTGEPPTVTAPDPDRDRAKACGSTANAPTRTTPVTMYFKPKRSRAPTAAKCSRAGATPATFRRRAPSTLPEALPNGPSRSFAWANASSATPYGERVITGLGEGVSLRLEGTEFKRVLALGGSEPPNDVGGTLGAAFSSAREGWLGNDALPVHLTLDPAPDLPHALAGALPPRAGGGRAAAGRAGRCALERSARGRRRRRGRALQAGRGLAAGKPVRPRREGGTRRAAARGRLADPEPRLRGRGTRRRCGCGGRKPGCGNQTRRRR